MSRPESAVVFRELGGPEVLSVEDASPRPVADNDVRIDVAAFALNRADLMFIHGEHYTIPAFPSRIGSEAVGTVTEIGKNITAFNIGDRVTSIPFYTTTDGVQGTTAVLPGDYLTLAPPELSDAEACSVWMQYLTSYFAFAEVANLGSDDTVLVTAAASSAGLGAIEVARALGARVIATTRTEKKRSLLLEAGASEVALVGVDDVGEVIDRTTDGKGVRVAFDPIGGESLGTYVHHLAPNAVIFGYGTLSDQQPVIPMAAMCRTQSVFHPYSMFNHVGRADERQRGVDFILERIGSGALRPRVDRVFAFDQVLDAYRYMESNEQSGKIVVQIG
ncbi:NADPH:quinone reductase-like Zn-dependent oxidoreductase [Arthrobacter sp. 1088]|uniref:zinc-dependent alcohol dehydrogenase family protein n=1 Tax=Arthrobacter sp. 1088 TaxID=2817768 RepID=UPI002860292E|nr:zinc-dependent alcohol dehydrogenase family protein [Arthrobacter sp. 1088]MDR6685377.1 NADPH:quinone reductase-like Zn-dependent oxidoreductase [Arthrobacter sp. 1088]